MKTCAPDHSNLPYWRAGAEAFAKLGLGLPPYYVCPLCIRGFTQDQAPLLTREHVPPRAVGGRRLVLTCLDCNNFAGHEVDSHAAEFERVHDFLRAKPGGPVSVQYQGEGGIDVNAQAEWSTDGSLSIAGSPRCNRPGAVDHLNDELARRAHERRGLPTSKLSVRLRHPVSPRRASVSWLRATYLAAFAALGYRYAIRKELRLVREQIRQPETSLIKWYHQKVQANTADNRAIMLLSSPRWARGVAVHMGEHLVLLPYNDDADAYYERLVRRSKEETNVTIAGKCLPWPERADFRLDHAAPSELAFYIKVVEGEL